MLCRLGRYDALHERRGSRFASEVQAEASPQVDVAGIPPAIPCLEAESGTDVHLPGPSSVSGPGHSPQSLLVRGLTGCTLVLQWNADDSLHDVMWGVSERTGVRRLCGGSAVPGAWVCNQCHMGGCWPMNPRCFRCGAPTPVVAQDSSGSGNPRREKQYLGKAPNPKAAPINPTYREPLCRSSEEECACGACNSHACFAAKFARPCSCGCSSSDHGDF